MTKRKIFRGFIIAAALTLGSGYSQAQEDDCADYVWPEVIEPCPEVQIKQKHDHTPKISYRREGWDTVVTCTQTSLTLSCMPYIPTKFFNGTYIVEEIPYSPTDTSYYINYPGFDTPNLKKVPIQNDDDFTDNPTQLGFPFYFFGIQKNQFTIGDNGIVTFTTTPMSGPNPFCPYSIHTPIPWNSSNSYGGFSSYIDRTHDAIYGVYEDTYTGVNGQYMDQTQNPHCGIYYGVIDDFPCRKIIASWKSIPLFGNTTVRNTYQIVCYEGSNIIEVHVQHHGCCPSTSDALIGIQNATGDPQVPSSDPFASNSRVVNGSPAAFWPSGYNLTTSTFNNKSFRFTPQGTHPANAHWYRIFEDGRDSVELPIYNPAVDPAGAIAALADTNGYYIPMGVASTSCETLTKAIVSPTCVSKYVFHLKFSNANGDWYNLLDTIVIGVDTVNDLSITKAMTGSGDDHVLDVCQGNIAAMVYSMNSIADTAQVVWHVTRVNHGDTTELPRSLLELGNIVENGDVKTMSVNMRTGNLPDPPRNKVDSIYVQCIVDFKSGCHNNDMMLVKIFPNFDTTTVDGICKGESYVWDANGRTYRETTDPRITVDTLQSTPGCDSVVHLNLTVFDVSHTIDHVQDCKPITWLNGKTYSENNTATAAQDTIVLKNLYGCDSVVQLDFVIHPLTAKIESNIEYFTLDNLEAVLTDVSIGGNGRVWKLPQAADQTGVKAYYSIAAERDGADIMLIESSQYGCIDTAQIYLPLNKEHFWVPNAFTPDNPAGNNTFGSVSTKTLRQEMLIYNRRGEMVFRCEGIDCSWDGRDLNGETCIQGAYVYIIRYTTEFEPKKTQVRKGTVMLLR